MDLVRLIKTKKFLLLVLVVCGSSAAVVFTIAHEPATQASTTTTKHGPVLTSSILNSKRNKDKKENSVPPASSGVVVAKKTTTKVVAPATLLPSSILGLANWKLALPIDTPHAGTPDEIKQPELAGFSSPYFHVNTAASGVVFNTPVGGATTTNSGFPRSELREMIGGSSASWSNSVGTHTLVVREAITHLPAVKPEVVAAQIHDATDDVIMVRLERSHLFVESSSQNIGDLDVNYALGSVFAVKIVASDSRIKVFYNDILKVDFARAGAGYYFKAGCYTQSNPSKGDSSAAYGEVVIYGLQVQHS